MGYDLHIRRVADGVELAEAERIAFESWQALVENDPHLRPTGFAEGTNPRTGEVLRYESPGLAVWTGHPNPDIDRVLLDWRDGEIVVRSPDDAVLAKLREIAAALGARIQGDEGEFYDESAEKPDADSSSSGGLFSRLFRDADHEPGSSTVAVRHTR